ncbi:hypothetical protein [Acinetobacter sp. MD2]|uniref:hypothetical protein n=1 Tax=Acinetobacter sp. MD2 TaxID=2600066 RepID=UPI002D1F3438|nr:hypothetical protein [Acinetobacter sp. MD2]MEB3768207.1 hypothetical protein [Acinetobacter sp. MD2]
MNLEFTHKPNYFLFAQLLIRHVQQYIKQHPTANLEISTETLKNLFHNDTASATTNLDGILNIADEYKVETLQGDQKIIQSYIIDSVQHLLKLSLNSDAVVSLNDGKPLIEPNANDYT